jgi:hypothetical protein
MKQSIAMVFRNRLLCGYRCVIVATVGTWGKRLQQGILANSAQMFWLVVDTFPHLTASEGEVSFIIGISAR